MEGTTSASRYSYDVVVVPGKGTAGTKNPESDEKRAEIKRISGIDKVPGSLNLVSRKRIWLRRRAGVPWSRGLMYRGCVGGIDVAFSKRRGFGASPRLFHVYADCHLKSALSVSDGDMVRLEIPAEAVSRIPQVHDLVYFLRLLRRWFQRLVRRVGAA